MAVIVKTFANVTINKRSLFLFSIVFQTPPLVIRIKFNLNRPFANVTNDK